MIEKISRFFSGQRKSIENVNEQFNYIFIHIPKCAGTSISRSIGLKNSYHYTSNEVKCIVGKKAFRNYFKFSFIRNPWDRFLSLYNYSRLEESYYYSCSNRLNLKKHPYYDLLINLSLHECAELLIENKLRLRNSFFPWAPQHKWTHDKNDILLLDFVGRYENLNEDFSIICQEIGIPKRTVYNINKSTKDNFSYRGFYTSKTRDIISKYYKRDIELFNYEF